MWSDAETRFADIQAAEMALLASSTRRDATAAASLLHPDFVEIGRSGTRWTRGEIVDALAAEAARPTPDTGDWAFTELGSGQVLVTYCIHGDTGDSRHSSIWERTGTGAVMRFHQGTRVSEATKPAPAPPSESAPPQPGGQNVEARAERLKERIYLIFAALAVAVALGGHGGVDAADALVVLAVTMLGTVLAIFTADVISHLVVHGRPFTAAEYRNALGVSFGALGAVATPFILLLISLLTGWSADAALHVSSIALVASLIVVGYLAVRRTPLSTPQRLVALGAEAVLGLVVVSLQVFAHS